MKKLMILVFAALTFSSMTIKAQLPGPPPPPRPAPAAAPLKEVAAFRGQVIRMLTNDDYVYDGFYLLSNGDSLLVKFPPHLGAQVTAQVKSGAAVTVTGVQEISPAGVKELRMISLNINGQMINDEPPAVPSTPPADKYVNGSGSVTAVKKDPAGMPNGLILDNKTILNIPPPVAAQLTAGLQAGITVAYTGMQKAAANGEVAADNYKLIRCQTITLNGKQYSIQ